MRGILLWLCDLNVDKIHLIFFKWKKKTPFAWYGLVQKMSAQCAHQGRFCIETSGTLGFKSLSFPKLFLSCLRLLFPLAFSHHFEIVENYLVLLGDFLHSRGSHGFFPSLTKHSSLGPQIVRRGTGAYTTFAHTTTVSFWLFSIQWVGRPFPNKPQNSLNNLQNWS